MADMPSGFWGGWIVVFTLVSLAGVAWLVLSLYFSPDAKERPDVEPVWDTDIREGHHAPPMWWFFMLFGAMLFSLIYLLLFPGLGNYKGLLDWSQGSRVSESYAVFNEAFDATRLDIANMDLVILQNDMELMAVAERIFTRECSACHGPQGRGQALVFPNLHDVDWQWGASVEQIEASIRQGRRPMMPAWEAILGEEGIVNVADYVMLLDEGGADSHPGKTQYEQMCVACHGIDGSGNILLGAQKLSDSIWLYGGDVDAIQTSLRYGRSGVMPAFNERLDDTQIKLLVALLARQ